MLIPWLSSLSNNPNLEKLTAPTECLSGQNLARYFVWENISKVVKQSGKTKETEHGSMVGPPKLQTNQL